jgi:hypothetical protein
VGFSLIETAIAMALSLLVTTAALSLVNPNQMLFQAQPEALDMQQRVRTAADALTRDLTMASAVAPRRAGDPAGVVRTDAVTISNDGETHSYYFDAAASQLRHFDGLATDVPVADNVVALAFEFSGGPDHVRDVRVSIRVQAARPELRGTGAEFVKPGTTRVSQRYVPDAAVTFRVSPRNMNLDL